MPRYAFQESRIWEAGDPVDPDGRVHKTKQRALWRARRSLPAPGTGRKWILISIDGEPVDDRLRTATTEE